MKSLTILSFLFSLILLLSGCGSVLEVYVSPDGDDRGAGTLAAPFATLERARDAVRQRKAYFAGDICVNLRAGTYCLDETLVLGPADAAAAGRTITWRGYQDERAIVSSGVRVTGWQKVTSTIAGLPQQAAGKLWAADISPGIQRPLTLYQGETRLERARTQEFSPDTEIHPRDNPSDALDNYTLYFPDGAVKNWANLDDAELFIIPSFPWWMNILSFASVDEVGRMARTTIPATAQMCPMVQYARDGFETNAWIENVPEGMTEPGRWMVNTQQRKIYYWPADGRPGEDIVAPALRELIRVEGVNDAKGHADRPVTGLCFYNLDFTQADRGTWDADDAGIQHDWEMVDKDNAMLRFRGAADCRVEKCRFYNAGGNAIRLDLYARRIAVDNCLFRDLGQSAVMMIGYGPGTKDVNKFNRVCNNHIHHCGQIYWHSQMITAFQSGYNIIAHNTIHHVPRKAICISGVRDHFLKDGERHRRECVDTIRWDEIGDAMTHQQLLPYLHSRHNVIEYNDVHHVLEKLGDGAAINLSGGGVGNIVRCNYVHDIPAEHPTCGIRMDEDQTDTLIEKNVIVNMATGGITPKQENMIRNNFIIQVSNYGDAGFIRAMGLYGLSHVRRNILYNVNPKRHFYARSSLDDYGPEVFAKGVVDENVYFCPGMTEDDFSDLVILKGKGADAHSVFADPLFVDWQNGDFRLQSDSPALKLGIEPIDITPAGLTEAFPFSLDE